MDVAPPAPPTYTMSPEQPQRPAPGRIQEPSQVLVLSAVTLTVYFYVWLWRVTGEVDAYAKRPGWSRKLAMAGIVVAAAGAVLSVVTGLAFGVRAALSQGAFVVPAWVSYAGLVGVAAIVLVTLALRRVWTALAEDARAFGRAPPNPDALTGMSLVSALGSVVGLVGRLVAGASSAFNPIGSLGSLLSLAGLVLWFVVLHRTQTELNAAWRGAQERPA